MSSSHLAALPAGQVPQVTTPGSSYKSCRTFLPWEGVSWRPSSFTCLLGTRLANQ